ncbi:unnamed protein product [Symbiodinium natans]|uniref:Uncharacterized protein n=1 Tax=Symbiodinium natans TaxID=878477 RepID=A0A812LS28_9DINO|nr:unnamed protein product [Symbiodinium natans]
MDLLDKDGDCIHFIIDASGKLKEYVNGKLEIEDVRWLEYSAGSGSISDAKGVFQLQEQDQVEKALGLHALASRAGIDWRGDAPPPPRSLLITDTDGDRLEFVFNEDGKLQEFNNGEVDLEEVTTMCFKFADGSVTDDTGVFTLPPRECMQKVAALYALALQAGIRWTGDHPLQAMPLCVSVQPVGSEPKVLDIENCAGDWEYECPKLWESLTPTDVPNQRFCSVCKENVYFCESIEEINAHSMQRRCVAFLAREAGVGAASATTKDSRGLSLHIALLSGEELPQLSLPAEASVHDVKKVGQLVLGFRVRVEGLGFGVLGFRV